MVDGENNTETALGESSDGENPAPIVEDGESESSSNEPVCDVCGMDSSFAPEDGMLTCERCKKATYCSVECLKWAWDKGGHADSCIDIRGVEENPDIPDSTESETMATIMAAREKYRAEHSTSDPIPHVAGPPKPSDNGQIMLNVVKEIPEEEGDADNDPSAIVLTVAPAPQPPTPDIDQSAIVLTVAPSPAPTPDIDQSAIVLTVAPSPAPPSPPPTPDIDQSPIVLGVAPAPPTPDIELDSIVDMDAENMIEGQEARDHGSKISESPSDASGEETSEVSNEMKDAVRQMAMIDFSKPKPVVVEEEIFEEEIIEEEYIDEEIIDEEEIIEEEEGTSQTKVANNVYRPPTRVGGMLMPKVTFLSPSVERLEEEETNVSESVTSTAAHEWKIEENIFNENDEDEPSEMENDEDEPSEMENDQDEVKPEIDDVDLDHFREDSDDFYRNDGEESASDGAVRGESTDENEELRSDANQMDATDAYGGDSPEVESGPSSDEAAENNIEEDTSEIDEATLDVEEIESKDQTREDNHDNLPGTEVEEMEAQPEEDEKENFVVELAEKVVDVNSTNTAGETMNGKETEADVASERISEPVDVTKTDGEDITVANNDESPPVAGVGEKETVRDAQPKEDDNIASHLPATPKAKENRNGELMDEAKEEGSPLDNQAFFPSDDPWGDDVLADQASNSPKAALSSTFSSEEDPQDDALAANENQNTDEAAEEQKPKDVTVWLDFFDKDSDDEEELPEFDHPEEFDGAEYLLSLCEIDGPEEGGRRQSSSNFQWYSSSQTSGTLPPAPSEQTVEKAQHSWGLVRGMLSSWKSNKPVVEKSEDRRQRMDSMA